MDWKKFFKFTKEKAISYLILILISGIAMVFTRIIGVAPPILAQIVYFILIYPPIYLLMITNINALLVPINERGLGNLIIFLLGLILVLVYQYLLICIFAWIINKIKKF